VTINGINCYAYDDYETLILPLFSLESNIYCLRNENTMTKNGDKNMKRSSCCTPLAIHTFIEVSSDICAGNAVAGARNPSFAHEAVVSKAHGYT